MASQGDSAYPSNIESSKRQTQAAGILLRRHWQVMTIGRRAINGMFMGVEDGEMHFANPSFPVKASAAGWSKLSVA